MYLHIGKNESIRLNELVGIFDIETSTESQATRAYLKERQSRLKVVNLCTDLPKSFIIVNGPDGSSVYITSLSAETLRKRIKEK